MVRSDSTKLINMAPIRQTLIFGAVAVQLASYSLLAEHTGMVIQMLPVVTGNILFIAAPQRKLLCATVAAAMA
jgi:hypothetical protein